MTTRKANALLRKSLAILSKRYDCTLKLNQYSDKTVCILNTLDNEIVAAIDKNHLTVGLIHFSRLYFKNSVELIKSLLQPRTFLMFHPLGKDLIEINFANEFGSSIDELKINLDMKN